MLLQKLAAWFFQVLREEKGQGLAEYGLILVLIAIAVVVALGALGGQLQAIFNQITTELTP